MSKATILIADSETHVHQTLHLLLESQLGFTVVDARDAESLLAWACRCKPDAILIDWALPGLRPQRMLAALHACCPNTPIMATGTQPAQQKAAVGCGVDAFVSKQLPPDQYVDVLLAAMDSESGDRPLA